MSRTATNRKYAVQRTLLILLMGSKCSYCRERRPWKLEFHHTKKSDWSPSKVARVKRVRLYLRDYAAGICVLACGTCNKKRGTPTSDDEVPF